MCDSFAALGNATADGSVLLAKNADCEINEAHHLLRVPRRAHLPGAGLRTTHLVIPQAPLTHATILSKSFWTWGAEIGFNEHGVAVGNEAVFTNQASTGDGIIVIDMLRLILERAASCDEAVDVVAAALEAHGQGGNCELRGNSHFDGGFLVSDRSGAVEIQTAGRHWAARRVRDISAISNVHSIRADWDRSSLAGQPAPKTDFRAAFTDEKKSWCAAPDDRQAMAQRFLEAHKGRITVRTMADALRFTGDGDYDPMDGDRPTRLCMHAAPYDYRLWQATGSMISQSKNGRSIGWVTGTSGPDVSIFKPVFCDTLIPHDGPAPLETDTPGALWWWHERLHRRAMADYQAVKPDIRAEFDALEEQFFVEGDTVLSGTIAERQAFADECWRRATDATARWIDRLESRPVAIRDPAYAAMWQRFNDAAALTL
ncbi:MAG: C69 family dipeptidase [Burkholderiales bacterium]|nr:C69 family dipeptidase [Burkholderiales bacterium]